MKKYNRLISLEKNRNFFLFGQRGTGKSTLLRERFANHSLTIDLLDSKIYFFLSKAPWKLKEMVLAKKKTQEIVLIDEIQKIPTLLNEVHKLIEENHIVFGLTGSSARKLKKEGVNLLSGRAHHYRLYPFTSSELGHDFDLNQVLQWGALPQSIIEKEDKNKEEYLYSYVTMYLKEEIILEQIVRQIEPFSRFLEVAAQTNGNIMNCENIAKDTGVSSVTIKTYFQILEDTLIGFFLPAYHHSIRKRQKQSPKFYFYDLGLVRALQNNAAIKPLPQTFEYGSLFESFLINEFIRLNEYRRTRYAFSHIRIDDTNEIDLVVERPGQPTLLIEIKSKDSIHERDVKALQNLSSRFKNARCLCLSQAQTRLKINDVLCLPWQDGLEEAFGSP